MKEFAEWINATVLCSTHTHTQTIHLEWKNCHEQHNRSNGRVCAIAFSSINLFSVYFLRISFQRTYLIRNAFDFVCLCPFDVRQVHQNKSSIKKNGNIVYTSTINEFVGRSVLLITILCFVRSALITLTDIDTHTNIYSLMDKSKQIATPSAKGETGLVRSATKIAWSIHPKLSQSAEFR